MEYTIIAYNTKKELTQDNAEIYWKLIESDQVKIRNIQSQSESGAISQAKETVSRTNYRVVEILF